MKPDGVEGGFAVSRTMRSYGFENGDVVTAINGSALENVLDANKYILLRDAQQVTVRGIDGTERSLSLPDSIGKMLFLRGERSPLSVKLAPVIDTVVPGGVADKAGLRKGDKVVSLAGEPIYYFSDIPPAVTMAAENTPVPVMIEREGQPMELTMTLDSSKRIGVGGGKNNEAVKLTHRTYSLGEAFSHGTAYGYGVLRDYIAQFKFVFTKKGASELGGFGAIGSLFPERWDWLSFWHITAFLSIILAFMNILPIPALDGGHVVFLLYEMITGRKPSEKVLEYAQMVGFVILISLLLYANGNDLYKAIFK